MAYIMSITLFRIGIWVIIATLAAYVIRETYSEETLGILKQQYLEWVLMSGFGAIGLGVLAWLGGKIAPRKKAFCKICRQSIPVGAVYCRIHLHEVLENARHTDVAAGRR